MAGVFLGSVRGREASIDATPLGPPGRRSLPFVIGLLATGFPFGVGLDTEFGDSPPAV